MTLIQRSALSVILTLGAHVASAAPRPWVEIKSPHFTVISDAGEGSARTVAWQFEQARVAFERLLPGARARGGKPFLVLAARDELTLKALAPKYWEEKAAVRTVSVHVTGADRHYLAVRVDSDIPDDIRASPYFDVYRAYVGIVLQSALDRPLPLWLQKGLSELYGNTRVRDKDILVGRLVPWHVQTLHDRKPMPLARLLAIDERSDYARDEAETYRFHATSWALVHYLMFGEKGALAPRLNQFIALWQQGRSQDVAFREAIGDVAGVAAALELYVSRPTLSYARFDVDVSLDKERFPVRTLTAAESAAVRAGFHVAMRRPTEARALIEEAKAATPPLAEAYVAEGLLLDGDSAAEPAKALAAYQKAADLGTTSFYAHYRAAQLVAGGTSDKDAEARAAKSLERAIEINPEYAAAYSYLAEIKSSLGQLEPALALARKAIELEPGRSYHHVALATVLSRLSRRGEAQTAAQRALGLAHEDWEIRNAQSMIDYLQSAPAAANRPAASADLAARVNACSSGDKTMCAGVANDLEAVCKGGESTACGALAWMYETGAGVAVDAARAAALHAQACEGGQKASCVRAAFLRATAKGAPGEQGRDVAALDRMCAEGTLDACTALGLVHARKGNLARARELLKKACDGGQADACRMVQSLPK